MVRIRAGFGLKRFDFFAKTETEPKFQISVRFGSVQFFFGFFRFGFFSVRFFPVRFRPGSVFFFFFFSIA